MPTNTELLTAFDAFLVAQGVTAQEASDQLGFKLCGCDSFTAAQLSAAYSSAHPDNLATSHAAGPGGNDAAGWLAARGLTAPVSNVRVSNGPDGDLVLYNIVVNDAGETIWDLDMSGWA